MELLSRGSLVRAQPGALFLKNSPIFDPKKIDGECKSKKVISLASSRHISRVAEPSLSLSVSRSLDFQALLVSNVLIAFSSFPRGPVFVSNVSQKPTCRLSRPVRANRAVAFSVDARRRQGFEDCDVLAHVPCRGTS